VNRGISATCEQRTVGEWN